MESLIHLTMSRPWISSCWLEKHILMRGFNIHQGGPCLCVSCSRLINLIQCGQGLHSAVCSIAQQRYCCTVLPLALALSWQMHSIWVSRREESACSMQPKLSTWYRTTDNSTEAPAQCWVQCCTTWQLRELFWLPTWLMTCLAWAHSTCCASTHAFAALRKWSYLLLSLIKFWSNFGTWCDSATYDLCRWMLKYLKTSFIQLTSLRSRSITQLLRAWVGVSLPWRCWMLMPHPHMIFFR